MTGKIVVLKGLPACGKSTYAKQLLAEDPKAIRLNKDQLREMFHFGGYNGRNERYIVELEYAYVEKLVAKGLTVVVDDTNLNPIHPQYYRTIAQEHNAIFEVKEFDTPVEECIARDKVREKPVGEQNIINMAFKAGILKQEGPCVVFDMDGTLCTVSPERLEMIKKKGDSTDSVDWDSFFEQCDRDLPRKDIIAKMKEHADQGQEVIICSARPEDYREKTVKWLADNGATYSRLIMRRTKDHRPDTTVKKEMLQSYLDKSKIVKWYDDRQRIIKMLREQGINVEDVGSGEEY